MSFLWFPHGHHVVSSWTPHGFKCGHHMVSRWTPYNFHVDTTWFPQGHYTSTDGNNIISIVRYYKMETTSFPHYFYGWKQCCFQVKITWFPCLVLTVAWNLPGNYKYCGLPFVSMSFPWFTYGNHVVPNVDTMWFLVWTAYSFHMDIMWCLGNHMETSTKNSSAWRQLASLFYLKFLLICYIHYLE